MLFVPLQEATERALNCRRENGRVHKAGRVPKEDLWLRHSRAVLSECFSWKAPCVGAASPYPCPASSRAAVSSPLLLRGRRGYLRVISIFQEWCWRLREGEVKTNIK